MEIVVCVKRVPDMSEAEPVIDPSGRAIATAGLAWGINEWDNCAVEAALRLKEAHGGRVTALTVGGEEDEEVLRRALAMGCDAAARLDDPAFAGSDAWCVATVLARAIVLQSFDLVLCGAVSSDENRGQVGGFLAAILDVPLVALATELVVRGRTARVRHEVEGGLERIVEVELPALVTVQTGLAEPRYVSVRGIQRAASAEIPILGAAALGLGASEVGAAAARVRTEGLSLPPRGAGAEILGGSSEEAVAALLDRLHAHGAL